MTFLPVRPSAKRIPFPELLRKAREVQLTEEERARMMEGVRKLQPGIVGIWDQMAAHQESMTDTLHDIAEEQDKGMFRADPSVVLALWLRALAVVVRRCEHISTWPPPHQSRIAIFLASQTAACPECVDQVALIDNGCCDLCDEPSDGFYPSTTALGAAAFSIEACESCFSLMQVEVVRKPGSGKEEAEEVYAMLHERILGRDYWIFVIPEGLWDHARPILGQLLRLSGDRIENFPVGEAQTGKFVQLVFARKETFPPFLIPVFLYGLGQEAPLPGEEQDIIICVANQEDHDLSVRILNSLKEGVDQITDHFPNPGWED